MQSPAGRLLALLSHLQARPHWNAGELAERLGVTARTVRRDVTRLRELGYPVVAEPGPHGGYQLGAGGTLPPLLLNDDEAVAVALGLRTAAAAGVTGYDDAAIGALAKLEQVLPVRLRERVAALNAMTTVLVKAQAGNPVDPDLLLMLAQGCRRLERLRFTYRTGDGREAERRVEPFRLVNAERRWYLVAHDLDREAWRTFRVDRISGAALTGHRFVRTAEPDAASMVAEGIALAGYAWQAEVLLHVEPAEAATYVAPTVGTLEPAVGGTVLRVGAPDLEWIARYLSGLPIGFVVRSPPELRAALRRLGRSLLRSGAPDEGFSRAGAASSAPRPGRGAPPG